MTPREKKLEEGLKAAMTLRKAIEVSAFPFKALLVPRAAVEAFDKRIEELKNG